jgi:hypothetical protein
MLVDGNRWSDDLGGESTVYWVEVIGDTLYQGIPYKKLSCPYLGDIFAREDTVARKVYGRFWGDQETLWYHFAFVGDTVYVPEHGSSPMPYRIDSISPNPPSFTSIYGPSTYPDDPRFYHLRSLASGFDDRHWLEGVGDVKGFLSSAPIVPTGLLCLKDSTNIVLFENPYWMTITVPVPMDSCDQFVLGPQGIASANVEQLMIHPVPTLTEIFISESGMGVRSIEAWSIDGRCHELGAISEGFIDISSLVNGVYTLQLTFSDNKILYGKFVVEK